MILVFLGIIVISIILNSFISGTIFLNFAVGATVGIGLMLCSVSFDMVYTASALATLVSFFTIRPIINCILAKLNTQKHLKNKYIGKILTATEKIDNKSGILSIYNERWQARTKGNMTIDCGQNMKITSYKDVVMYVEKV